MNTVIIISVIVGIYYLGKYAIEDSDFLLQLAHNLYPQLSSSLLKVFHELEMPIMLIVEEMEYFGFRVDVDQLNLLYKELTQEAQAREAASFDARTPLANIEKALADLSGRIDNITTSSDSVEAATIRKQLSTVEVPSTQDLASMDWSEVHNLAGSVFHN